MAPISRSQSTSALIRQLALLFQVRYPLLHVHERHCVLTPRAPTNRIGGATATIRH
jgi:hypothetical protein